MAGMIASAAPYSPAQTAPAHEGLHRQAVELEGVFLTTLMKEMFASLETESQFGGGFAEETWRGMQAEQMAAAMAEAGGIGLAEALLADLLAVQESVSLTPSQPRHGAYR